MSQLWIHQLVSAVITAVVAFLITTAAARLRFSGSRGTRWVLDILFFLPLVLPLQFIKAGSCVFSDFDAITMLPILYLCGIMGFHNVSRETLEAARLQGMGKCGTFWRFFVPAGWKWLLGGAAVLLVRVALAAFLFPRHCPYA